MKKESPSTTKRSRPICFGCMHHMKSLLACYGDFCPHIKKCEEESNKVLEKEFPPYIKTHITYDEEKGTFTAWDETESGIVGEFDSWIEAAYNLIEYTKRLENENNKSK